MRMKQNKIFWKNLEFFNPAKYIFFPLFPWKLVNIYNVARPGWVKILMSTLVYSKIVSARNNLLHIVFHSFFREITGVKRDAEEMMSDGDGDMSSDDTDFNPDALEALSAKEEYDSEPSSTSDDTDGEEVGCEYILSINIKRFIFIFLGEI